jgi:Ca2+-binding RTX toxin-like protein
MRLDGRAGSDTYLTYAVDGGEQNIGIKDVGNFWDLDRLIFEGSSNPDSVLVNDQEILRFNANAPNIAQQRVSYRSDAPDGEDLAAFNALGFTQADVGPALISTLADGSGLARLARFELRVNDQAPELVVVDPDNVRGAQTLHDIAEALNVSLEISDLDDSVEAVVEDGVLILRAIRGADQLTIDAVITGPGLEVMDVFGREGNDQIAVTSTPDFMAVAVSAGEGDDTILVGPRLEDIKGGPLTGPLVIHGDEGFNTLGVSDADDAAGDEGTLTRERLTGLGIGVAIEFFDIDDLSIVLGTGSDTFTVTATNSGRTSVFGNDGADVVDVLTASGVVSIAGDSGADVLSLDASDADSAATLSGGAGDDIVNVRAADGHIDMFGDAGSDIFNVGSEAGRGEPGTLNGINGPVSIRGGAGEDVLNIDDTFDGGDTLPARNPLAAMTELGRMTGEAVFSLQVDGGESTEINVAASLGTLRSGAAIDAGIAASGVLSGDATFVLEIGDQRISVLLKRDPDNTSLADLEADLAAALEFHDIDSDRIAVNIESDGAENRIVFTSLQGESLAVLVRDTNTARTELGLVDGEAATFSNITLADLIGDINMALGDAGLGGQLEAVAVDPDESFGRLGFTLLDASSVLLTDLNDVALDDLGFAENQFIQPDNVGVHALIDEAAMLRATITGLGMGTDGGGAPGIIYDTVELANISLGSGNDQFSVQGTLIETVTSIDAGAGDDHILVSDSAPARDAVRGHLDGTLDSIGGELRIQAGTGANTLDISDRESTIGDANVIISSSRIVGLAPGAINYSATGGFSGGINIWAGTGDDTVRFGSTLADDVTTFHANDGDDQITMTDVDGSVEDGVLVIEGGPGDDLIDGSFWNSALFIFGDLGEIEYQDRTRAIDQIVSASTIRIDIGGSDQIFGGSVADVLIGGTDSDSVSGGQGDDAVIGDGGRVTFDNGEIIQIEATDFFIGGGDMLAGGQMNSDSTSGGDGNDVIIGGAGLDILYGTLAEDILIYEYGRVTYQDQLATSVVVLGQRPLDLAAGTMFDLYLKDRFLVSPYFVGDVASDRPAIEVRVIDVSTGPTLYSNAYHDARCQKYLAEVGFELNSALLTHESHAYLQQAAQYLSELGGVIVQISGHADSIGSSVANQRLSLERAQAVVDALVEYGVNPAILRAAGYGEEQPVRDNATEQGRAANRRVEIEIDDGGACQSPAAKLNEGASGLGLLALAGWRSTRQMQHQQGARRINW